MCLTHFSCFKKDLKLTKGVFNVRQTLFRQQYNCWYLTKMISVESADLFLPSKHRRLFTFKTLFHFELRQMKVISLLESLWSLFQVNYLKKFDGQPDDWRVVASKSIFKAIIRSRTLMFNEPFIITD